MMMTYNKTSNAEAIEIVYTYDEWMKVYRSNKAKEKAKKQEKAFQKLLGIALVAVGLLGCAIFPEDAGGCLFACILGIIRVIC